MYFTSKHLIKDEIETTIKINKTEASYLYITLQNQICLLKYQKLDKSEYYGKEITNLENILKKISFFSESGTFHFRKL